MQSLINAKFESEFAKRLLREMPVEVATRSPANRFLFCLCNCMFALCALCAFAAQEGISLGEALVGGASFNTIERKGNANAILLNQSRFVYRWPFCRLRVAIVKIRNAETLMAQMQSKAVRRLRCFCGCCARASP